MIAFLLPTLQPPVTRDMSIVLVGPAVAMFPVVELARACGQIVGNLGRRHAVISLQAVRAKEGLGCIGMRSRMISENASRTCCPDKSDGLG